MANVHGKNTYISINGSDISGYCKTSSVERGADSHDLTPYGVDDHVVSGGLLKGSFTVGGNYDSSQTVGPRAVLKGIVGTVVELIRRPEGTGTGLPQETMDILVEKYVETNPVADYISWSLDATRSGPIVDSTQ